MSALTSTSTSASTSASTTRPYSRSRISAAKPERPLYGLRLRLTAWYVGTFAVTLLGLGIALFVLITRQIGASLDRSLDSAVDIAERAVLARPLAEHDAEPAAVLRGIRIPDRALYLFDGAGQLLFPDTASRWVRHAALVALHTGRGAAEADIGGEHTLRTRAQRFIVHSGGLSGGRMVVAASADTEELEDAYAHVIGILAATLTAALLVLGLGGYLLARKSSRPVEESFEHMRRFMADAAHELRTPVAVLRARLEIALQQPRDAAYNIATLREASTETERVATVIDDLFTLTRAEAGEQRPERRHVSLDDIAFEAVERARVLAERRGVRLDFGTLAESAIVGDPALIERLSMILLDNAIKYTPPAGVVRIAVEHVGHDRCALVVSDTGVGIEPDALPHIFDRFYRAERTRTSAEGSGLGLAIARWIAEVHHAEITVHSEQGVGTSFRVTFPQAA